MKKILASIAAASLLVLGLSGCSSPSNSDTFISQLESSYAKSVELGKTEPFLYTSQMSGSLIKNTIYKNNGSVSVFELSDVKLNCSITFNVITSFAQDKPVAPLALFSANNKVSEVVSSLKAFAKTNKSSEWITKNDGLYLISEGTTGVSVLSIGLNSDKAFSFYTGFASDVSFTETVKLITAGTEHAWPSPTAAMFYAYTKDEIQMSYTLPMNADWWLENFDKIAATDINKIVEADKSTTLEYTPVISNSGVLLLMKQTGKAYKFFNIDKTPYLEKGKQLVCKEI